MDRERKEEKKMVVVDAPSRLTHRTMPAQNESTQKKKNHTIFTYKKGLETLEQDRHYVVFFYFLRGFLLYIKAGGKLEKGNVPHHDIFTMQGKKERFPSLSLMFFTPNYTPCLRFYILIFVV